MPESGIFPKTCASIFSILPVSDEAEGRMQITPKVSRTRTIGFRLTEAEYQQLVAAAQQEQRRTADLVRLIVVRALKAYATSKTEAER
jgi:hypothetical protein